MKKILSLLAVVVISLAFTVSSYAAGADKLKGGFEKLVKSPLQLKDDVIHEYDAAKFKPFGIAGGLIKGAFDTGKEAVGGLVDILTFPVDLK